MLLVHPGGPFWRNRDEGAWQIPKGMIMDGESPEEAACREVEEELGVAVVGTPEPLGTIRQSAGKIVEAFTLEQDFDPAGIRSNLFSMEWPPKSGQFAEFPEVDAARWLPLEEAGPLMLESQRPLLQLLHERLGG